MTITLVFLYVGIFAALFSAITRFVRKPQNAVVDYLKNFIGGLLIFSGFVKAVDPVGTALKMEEYFGEFAKIFSPSISWVFPMFKEQALFWSIVTIVFEIVLGINFLFGVQRKSSTWSYLMLMGFFTALTGYTCLTGYTPGAMGFILILLTLMSGLFLALSNKGRWSWIYGLGSVLLAFLVNFLLAEVARFHWYVDVPNSLGNVSEAGKAALQACNLPITDAGSKFVFNQFNPVAMKITDCGCFGDFLKLNPCTSFYKDLFLLPFGFIFLFLYKQITPLNSSKSADYIVPTLATILTTAFCLYNVYLSEPIIDFRPFSEGVSILEAQKAANADMPKVSKKYTVLGDNCTKIELTEDEYQSEKNQHLWDTDKYPVIKTEEVILHEGSKSKIKDFVLNDVVTHNNVADSILQRPNYKLFVVAYDLHVTSTPYTKHYQDSIFRIDTTYLNDSLKTMKIAKNLVRIDNKSMETFSNKYDSEFIKIFTTKINPLVEAAQKKKWDTFALTRLYDPSQINDFRHEAQTLYPFYMADDKLVKTIMRSNPGLILMKGDKILKKWHWKQIPQAFDELKSFQ